MMDMDALQLEIVDWARDTFGTPPAPQVMAARMNREVAELLSAVAKLDANPNAWSDDDWQRVRGEIADVGIVLVQLAENIGCTLRLAMVNKFEVNKEREWAKDEHGTFQHKK